MRKLNATFVPSTLVAATWKMTCAGGSGPQELTSPSGVYEKSLADCVIFRSRKAVAPGFRISVDRITRKFSASAVAD
jgi:hypothetical protein